MIQMKFTRVFIHGLESSGRGTKGVFFRARYPDMLIEDFEGSLEQRLEKLDRVLAGREPLILVGSSFGGLMAAIYACRNSDRVLKLILLAPALHLDEFKPFTEKILDMPVSLFHGSDDDVVPPGPVLHIAEKIYSNLSYHLVKDDHALKETFPTYDWDALLSGDA